MSAHQMICHLSDSAGGKPVRGWRATPAAAATNVGKWISARTCPAVAAEFRRCRKSIQQVAERSTVEFTADVAQLEALLEFITRRERAWTGRRIDFWKDVEAAWLRLGYLTSDHHLRSSAPELTRMVSRKRIRWLKA